MALAAEDDEAIQEGKSRKFSLLLGAEPPQDRIGEGPVQGQ
jgi:hypothetical protein